MRIAYLCNRLGPYHFAQLNAAQRYADILALEYSREDLVYAWDPVEDVSDFCRLTLFRGTPIRDLTVAAVNGAMWKALEQGQPDVVAMMGWNTPSSLAALKWCAESHTPAFMMSDSQECDRPRTLWKESIKRRIVRLTTAGFVGGLSHADYLKSLGMAEQRIVPGCDVVDNRYFEAGARAAQEKAAAVRRQLSLPDKYFLASARFIPEKNLPNLLRSYAAYLHSTRNDPWHLVLLGDGELRDQLVKTRDDLGLSGMVIFPGFIQYQELPLYYGLAQTFVLASISETWGLVVNEAMASGLPVLVSSRCGCVRDLVRHGENGFIFEPNDIEALSKHFAFMASDACPRGAMGDASQRIIRDWDLDLFARNLVQAAELARSGPQRMPTVTDKLLLRMLAHWYSS